MLFPVPHAPAVLSKLSGNKGVRESVAQKWTQTSTLPHVEDGNHSLKEDFQEFVIWPEV